MADALEDRLARMRGAAAPLEVLQDATGTLEQFRQDFKAVWHWRRHCGEISQDELRDGMAAAGREIKDHMNDTEWMATEMVEFSAEADQMRRDLARSERIRVDVRAQREAA